MRPLHASRALIGLGGALLLALIVCLPAARAAEDESSVPRPLGAKLFYSYRHFYPYGMNPQAVLIEQQIYRYPYETRQRLFWVYRVTNLVRINERGLPNRVVAFQLGIPSGIAIAKDAMPEGWISGLEGTAGIEWQATAGTDAVLFPGYVAEFAFATERRNLAPGSGELQLQGDGSASVIEIGGSEAPQVPGDLLTPDMVDCCMPYNGGVVCGGTATEAECVQSGGTVGCGNCGTAIVACCHPNSDCGYYPEELCTIDGGTVMGSCGSCPIAMVTCCQTPSMGCGQMPEEACRQLGFPVGSCSSCKADTPVNCCNGNGHCDEVAAGECGGTVVADCATCGWVPARNRTWGSLKTLYR
jgi:hypothetical protein